MGAIKQASLFDIWFQQPVTWLFDKSYEFIGWFQINIEVNHATLAQHTFEHELQVAADNGLLGEYRWLNRGIMQNGMDTDPISFWCFWNHTSNALLFYNRCIHRGGIKFRCRRRDP